MFHFFCNMADSNSSCHICAVAAVCSAKVHSYKVTFFQQFVAWNGAYLKIAVEKGYFTFEYILELIELYKGWMPQ